MFIYVIMVNYQFVCTPHEVFHKYIGWISFHMWIWDRGQRKHLERGSSTQINFITSGASFILPTPHRDEPRCAAVSKTTSELALCIACTRSGTSLHISSFVFPSSRFYSIFKQPPLPLSLSSCPLLC